MVVVSSWISCSGDGDGDGEGRVLRAMLEVNVCSVRRIRRYEVAKRAKAM